MGETRKLAAILVSDVVGYSRLAGADKDRILARLRALRSDLIDPTVAPDKRIEFRIGIHLGDVVEESDARPGAICLSEDAYRQGSGPEFQPPSLLPIMSEASLYRPRTACRLG